MIVLYCKTSVSSFSHQI